MPMPGHYEPTTAMKEETVIMFKDITTGGLQCGVYTAALSVITGASMATVPTTTKVVFITLTTGSVTAVSWPALVAFAAGGAVLGGAAGGLKAWRKCRRVNQEFARYHEDETG